MTVWQRLSAEERAKARAEFRASVRAWESKTGETTPSNVLERLWWVAVDSTAEACGVRA